MGKCAVVACFEVLTQHVCGMVEETRENLYQNSPSPDRDSKRAPAEYIGSATTSTNASDQLLLTVTALLLPSEHVL